MHCVIFIHSTIRFQLRPIIQTTNEHSLVQQQLAQDTLLHREFDSQWRKANFDPQPTKNL